MHGQSQEDKYFTVPSDAECEKKEDVMSDVEDMFIVEDPDDEEKREALLRNVEVCLVGRLTCV